MLMILSCEKNIERVKIMRESWLNKCSVPYVFVFGQEDLSPDYDIDLSANILLVKCNDGYDYLSHKVKAGIQSIIKIYNPNYIIKCDDDVYVDPEMLNEYVEYCLSKNIKYHGHPHYERKGSTSTWCKEKYILEKNKSAYVYNEHIVYCMGPFYYLSREASQILSDTMDPDLCRFEDVCVGLTLKKKNIIIDSDEKLQKYMYTNIIRDFLSHKFMCWHDISHHTFNNEAVIEKSQTDKYMYPNISIANHILYIIKDYRQIQ